MKTTLALSLFGLLAFACGGGGGGGDNADANPLPGPGDAFPATGAPITAPDTAWTWIDFPDSICRNGTTTGIGVSLNSASNRVYIHLQGGGACFDTITCSGNPLSFNSTAFASWRNGTGRRGVFNRQNANNPMADYNHVFVPYCSGDIHGGDIESGVLGEPQRGYANIGEYLQRLVPTFPNAELIVFGGSSAGGFGAAYNYDRVHRAFGDIPMRLLDDSGPPLGPQYMTPCFQDKMRVAWNLDSTLPPDCADCSLPDGSGFQNMTTYLARKFPNERLGIISSTQDTTIRQFFSFGYPDCDNPAVLNFPPNVYEDGVYDLGDGIMGPFDNAQMFMVRSDAHVWLTREPFVTSGGVNLGDWIGGLIDGGPDWQPVRP